ncbi:MAG: serine/threonine protein kinase [Planctomycetes bacterium]|nr:serine/threonine protein kinase [Planctomycetota bacterium]
MANDPEPASGSGSASPSEREQLNRIVADYLDQREPGETESLEKLCEQYPQFAAKLRKRVAALDASGLLDAAGGDLTNMPKQLGDFRILRELGGGGMGIVYEAEQISLKRIVALKLIRPDYLFFDASRERFQREVEAISRLQHPNIVPIYTVGQERGVPYFAMERVIGKSLGEIIEKIASVPLQKLSGHYIYDLLVSSPAAEAPGPLFEGSWVDVCLRVAEQVAVALAHAHERGVLHRDVKPSNIMITPEGRVLLLDFGLAVADGASRMTQTGTRLGSLPYTPPELLSGKTNISNRSDIYSLGVNLYEMLTRQLPFIEQSPQSTIRLILDGDAPPLRRLNPYVSSDVATVCLKAMDPIPARRYESATAFAGDLANARAGRPIQARPMNAFDRARRWTSRHPARAAVAALLILLVVGVPSGIAYIKSNHARELYDLYTKEQRARNLAEENFNLAVFAVDRMLTRVGSEDLLNIPQVEPVRKELLEDALEFSEYFLKEKTDDPKLLRQRGRALIRVAGIRALLGEHSTSQMPAREGIALFEGFLKSDPDNHKDLVDLSEAYRALVKSMEVSADPGPTLELYKHICEIDLKALAAPNPSSAASSDTERFIHDTLDLAKQYQILLRFAEAEKLLRDLTAGPFAQFIHTDPKSAATIHIQLSQILREQQKLEEAETSASAALDAIDKMGRAAGESPALLENLASVNNTLSLSYLHRGKTVEAVRLSQKAVELRRKNVNDFPWTPGYRKALSYSLNNLGLALSDSNKNADAESVYEECTSLMNRMVANDPLNIEYQIDLTQFLINRDVNLYDIGKMKEAESLGLDSIERLEKIIKQLPESAPLHKAASVAENSLGNIYFRGENFEKATAEYSKAVAHLRDAIRIAGKSRALELELAGNIINLGNAFRNLDRLKEARPLLNEGLQIMRDGPPEESNNNPVMMLKFAQMLNDLAEVDFDDGSPAVSKQNAHEAAKYELSAIAAIVDDSHDSRRAEEQGMIIMLMLVDLEDYNFALEYAAGAAERYKDKINGGFQAATWLGQAAGACKDSIWSEKFAVRAVEQLKALPALGFDDAALVERSPSFEKLRTRPDFKEAVAAIRKK